MSWIAVHPLILMMLSCPCCAEEKVTVSCPENQKAFERSCYEFVGLQRNFFSAQAWCEHRGGHLAFIPDEETQYFLQRHLDPKKDMWLGVAPSASSNLQYTPTVEGPLSWLDGSHITYSNWVSSPQPEAACGYILRDSGFQWQTTRVCDKKMHFICQFESGRFIVCAGQNPTLQCDSGQVLMIDGGVYDRENIHYCRSTLSSPTPTQCSWVDVIESLKAHCQHRQICQITEIGDSFGKPCPHLLLDYHCEDGLILSVSTLAAVYSDVTISVKWLLHLPMGNLSCNLSTGDSHVIYLHSPEGMESNVVHKYAHPSTFLMTLECTSSDIRISAQKIITIQEPITEFGVIRCYAGTLSFPAVGCKALYGEEVQIQVELIAGTNVTYKIHSGQMMSGLSVLRGNVPQNITLTPDLVVQLGPGCHQLTLYASNMVTLPERSKDMQMCVLEKVAGLQATVLTARDDCLNPTNITIGVSLERGAPVLLLFSLTGDSSFSDTREMNTRKEIFHIGNPSQGHVQVKLRAWNIFSSLEVDVDMLVSCGKDSLVGLNSQNDDLLRFSKRLRKKHIRVARSPLKVTATPSKSVHSRDESIILSVVDASKLKDKNNRYEWECRQPCKCQGKFAGLTHTVQGGCLPDPFEFNKYRFKVIDKEDNDVEETKFICITLTPQTTMPSWLSLTCTQGCNPIKENTENAKMKIECTGQQCPQVVWNIEETGSHKLWPDETEKCYNRAKTKPLIKKQHGGTEYTVSHSDLANAKSRNEDVTVVITSEDAVPLYKKYTIKTSSSGKDPAPTTKNPFTADKTTKTKTVKTTAGAANASPGTDRATSIITTTTAIITINTSTATTKTNTASTTTDDKASLATTRNFDRLKCSISPPSGTILDAFKITCSTEIPCSNCQYCFKTHEGKHLRCTEKDEVKYVFLPLGDSSSDYKLIIKANAKSSSFVANTTINVQVLEHTENSVEGLKAVVENAVTQLKEHGLLSGETLGQLFSSVSDKLNNQSDESKKADRQKLREQMLDIMNDLVNDVPINTPEEVQVIASGLTAVIHEGTELNVSAQEVASLLFATLSSFLVHMDVNKSEENKMKMLSVVNIVVEGASSILDFSSNKNISDALVHTLTNIQSALLRFKDVNEGPTIIQQAHIGVFVNRVTPESLSTESINIPNCSCPTFSLPTLPPNILPSEDKPVDVRMLSLDNNPFSWKKRNISSLIGALSLTTEDGSGIPVENLSEDIEILLPRAVGEQVNTSVLDLRNYSTTVIDVPSADSTLVLKMVPSNDPLPFKLFLGYMDYPTETNYVAMTEMPHQGTTQEERYTWLLDPKILKGNTGVHYLVVRPIVGPGIKSINAKLSITSLTTACKFWDELKLDWSNYGCRVGVQTTHLVTQCLCNHLSFFGSSFFVTPNLVDPSRTAELFGTFAENPVVVCFVGALFVVYLLVVIWARRKDIQDTSKVKVTVLEDNNPMDEYRYLLSVSTGHRRGASTSSQVTITLLGAEGNSDPHHLTDPNKCVFERGAVDMFLLTTPFSLGDLQSIKLWHNNTGRHPDWYVGVVMVQDLQTEQKWHFLCNSWLAIHSDDCSLNKVFSVSTEMDLKRFSNLFFMKTTKDFSDGHLWYSVISRPPSSTFTCVQRVSCCFSLLLCTMLTSIMFYGIPTDPSEQTMDLGRFEFTWQQFMVGVQSSLIMFPVNFLIVSIFRNTRPRETFCCKRKTEKPDALEETSVSPTGTTNSNIIVTFDTVIKDIRRIAHSLSETVKSNIPCTESEFEPEQQADINAVLSVVEDFIKQNSKTSDTAPSKAQSFHNINQPQVLGDGASIPQSSAVEGIQRKSNKTQYLYQQICLIDKELSLLGDSSFPSTHTYSQALQKVQGMKGFLEDQLFTLSCANLEEVTQKKLNPAESTDGSQKKKLCCHGGLPWWFIFVGWLFVFATSIVAGYFTMLYGLNFGKERSVSWLVSMIVSFFQSVLVIQPLKVLCLAVFFALVIKKVDEDDFQNVPYVRKEQSLGDCKDQQTVRRDSSLYGPPPPADIARMRRNRILEQKAFALLWEILTYMGFMWMLLLVAYGQRDPNAFFLNQHIRNSFSQGISVSMSLGDVFTWANTSLLHNLFGIYPDRSHLEPNICKKLLSAVHKSSRYHAEFNNNELHGWGAGFITDGNSKLVGNARLRQLRVQKNSCQTAGSMLQFVPDCQAPYSWEAEDMGSYDPGWNSVRDNMSTSTSSLWKYQTQAQLRSYPVWGNMALYRGGGFVAEIGPDLENASSTIEHLFQNKWLDTQTRVIFVEFTVYNANVNLFCIVTLLLETTAVGAFQFFSELQSVRLYQSTGGLHIFVMAAEIIYLLFIIYDMFLQGKLMKQQRWTYFKSKWNLLELAIILLTWSAVAVFIKRTLLGNRDMTYYQNHRDQFASFYETATTDSVLQYLIAFLVLLATVKLWHLFRLNPKMHMITGALQRAWIDISGFLVIIVIMLMAYSTACNVIYGWKLSSYRTLADAVVTIISLQTGMFDYDEVLDNNPLLGWLLFGSCIVLITFVVLNLFISVILVAFNQEQIYHKPSDEEEAVELMLKKIWSFFGIRPKNKKDTAGLVMNENSGLDLNNSRNILNNSSMDVNIFQTSDN